MKKKVLIILAAIAGSFLAFLVLFYFLYPHLNEEKFEQVVSELNEEKTTKTDQNQYRYDETVYDELNEVDEYDELPNNPELLMAEQNSLQDSIDSLQQKRDLLLNELDELSHSVDSVKSLKTTENSADVQLNADNTAENMDEAREEFSERVKSLLNLEEEQLSPIVRQLSDEQLIRLYDSAGNIQREKLLRSLSADRAAKLMERIMS